MKTETYTLLHHRKLFIRLALILAVLFVMVRTLSHIAPYEYFASNDSYRDYDSINSYLLQSEEIPNSVSYHDRPNLYYFIAILSLTNGISLFDFIRIVVPLILGLSVLTFYLFYKEAFKKEYIAISGAVITILGNQFFNELVGIRPNIFALIMLPVVGYLFLRLWKNKYHIPTMVALCVSILGMHFTHFFGSLILACVVSALLWLYRRDIKRYFIWLVPLIILSIVITIFDPSNLLVSTLRHAYTIIIQRDPGVFINEKLSLSNIVLMTGFWYTLVAISGITVMITDLFKNKRHIHNMPILWLGLFLAIVMLFFAWIGPYIGFGILPIRMLVYLWLAVVIFFLYYVSRMQSSVMSFGVIAISMLVLMLTRLPNDAIDSGYILGKEIEVNDYIQENNIENALILTQATNTAVFIFDENNNTIRANWPENNNRLFNKIFYSESPKIASEAVGKLAAHEQYSGYSDVYIVYSTAKPTNTYLWPNDWFQIQSLNNANLANFYDGDYFTLVFDGEDIKMWKWTRKID